MPSLPFHPHEAGLTLHAALTARYTNGAGPPPLAVQVPGGLASPCPAVPGIAVHVAPAPKHCGSEVPGTLVTPLVQKERSPCFAASMATTVNPFPARVSATESMSARPPPSPCRNTTIGEHGLPNGARVGGHAGKLTVLFGYAIRTLIVSFVVAPVGLNAPFAGLIKLQVVLVVSSSSAMLPEGTLAASTPYLANALATVKLVGAAGRPVAAGCVYGSAPSCTAVERMLCVWNVNAIATCPLYAGIATSVANCSRIFSSPAAVALSMPSSCDCPLTETGWVNCRMVATVPGPID